MAGRKRTITDHKEYRMELYRKRRNAALNAQAHLHATQILSIIDNTPEYDWENKLSDYIINNFKIKLT